MKVFGALGETEDGEEKEAEQGSGGGGAAGFTEGNRGAAQMGGARGGGGSRKWRRPQVWGLRALASWAGNWHVPFEGTASIGALNSRRQNEKKSNGTKEERTRHGTRAGRLARRSPHGGRDRLRALRPACSLPRAAKRFSAPLRTLGASPPAHRGWVALCGAEGRGAERGLRAAAGRGTSVSVPHPECALLGVPPHLWRDLETGEARARPRTGAAKTAGRRCRLSGKVSIGSRERTGTRGHRGSRGVS